MRLPLLVDNSPGALVNGQAAAKPHATVPMRGQAYSASHVRDPAELARLLTRLEEIAVEATLYARAHPRAQSVTFYGVKTSTGGAKVALSHGLGQRVLWLVVGWRGSGVTTAPILVSDEADASPQTTPEVLWLRSYVAGTVDIEVWGLS
jgi:hypothetical protein